MENNTPMRAIRLKCLDCCCGQSAEVRRCPLDDCPLFPYRFGHRPKASDAAEAAQEAESGHNDAR